LEHSGWWGDEPGNESGPEKSERYEIQDRRNGITGEQKPQIKRNAMKTVVK